MPTVPVEIKEWEQIDSVVEERIASVLFSWEGTPYLPSTRIKSMGVDCYHIVAAFFDEMYRRRDGHTVLPTLSPDIARNRPDLALHAINTIREAHYGFEIRRDGIIQPGDVIVTRSILRNDGPLYEGHTMIAGVKPYTFLHAVTPRVCWGSVEGIDVAKVYRARNRSLWM